MHELYAFLKKYNGQLCCESTGVMRLQVPDPKGGLLFYVAFRVTEESPTDTQLLEDYLRPAMIAIERAMV